MSRPLSKYQKYKLPEKYQAGDNSPQFLEDFGSLPPDELCMLSKRRYDALCAWNNLQTTPAKRRNFTFSVFETSFSDILPFIKDSCPKYAYILHDKDRVEHNHYHVYVDFPNPRSFASVANDLHLPVNQLQKVISKKGLLSYLTHENETDKYHYSQSEVVSNFDLELEKSSDLTVDDIMIEFDDYCKMRRGEITPREFVERHAMQ